MTMMIIMMIVEHGKVDKGRGKGKVEHYLCGNFPSFFSFCKENFRWHLLNHELNCCCYLLILLLLMMLLVTMLLMRCMDAIWAPWEISRQIVILINVIIVDRLLIMLLSYCYCLCCCSYCCCCYCWWCCGSIKHIWNICTLLFANCSFTLKHFICLKVLINLKLCWGRKSFAINKNNNIKTR